MRRYKKRSTVGLEPISFLKDLQQLLLRPQANQKPPQTAPLPALTPLVTKLLPKLSTTSTQQEMQICMS